MHSPDAHLPLGGAEMEGLGNLKSSSQTRFTAFLVIHGCVPEVLHMCRKVQVCYQDQNLCI
jgi:hypothetical protein